MVANKQGKKQIRLAVNNVSRFSPRTARKTLELPRHGLARTIYRVATASLPTDCGEFRIIGYPSLSSDQEFVTLVRGEPQPDRPTPVRIHSQCLTGDVFGSVKCDCGPQLQAAMRLIADEGCGVIVYQQQEGRGIGS